MSSRYPICAKCGRGGQTAKMEKGLAFRAARCNVTMREPLYASFHPACAEVVLRQCEEKEAGVFPSRDGSDPPPVLLDIGAFDGQNYFGR